MTRLFACPDSVFAWIGADAHNCYAGLGRSYCCLLTEALARFPRALVHGFQSVGSGRVILRWRSFRVLPISLSHELIIFCGPRPGRRVGRQATGPLWDHIAQSSGELLVDGAARAQAAPHERNDKEDCKMAGADWHLRSVRNLKQLICTPVREIFCRRAVRPDWPRGYSSKR